MVGYSLAERCSLLHRLKPDERISVSSLQKLYASRGIKRKVIMKVKRVPLPKQEFCNNAIQYCKRRINELRSEGVPIIYLDEGVVTTKTMPKFEFAPKY